MAGTFFLPRLVGYQAAARLLLTGDLIPAEEALRLGIVLEVTQAEQVFINKCITP